MKVGEWKDEEDYKWNPNRQWAFSSVSKRSHSILIEFQKIMIQIMEHTNLNIPPKFWEIQTMQSTVVWNWKKNGNNSKNFQNKLKTFWIGKIGLFHEKNTHK
jgi:hypothetical protein